MAEGRKVQVYFDENSIEIIEKLQKASGNKSMAEVIRDALGLYNWTRKMHEQGYSVGTIKNGKAIQQLVLPFEMFDNK